MTLLNKTNTSQVDWNITYDASNHDIVFRELQLSILLIVLVTGAILNSALILLFTTRRSVEPLYYLLLNLAISNWIACAFILSRSIVSMFMAPHQDVNVPCGVWLAIDEVWWITQNWTLVAISFVRYRTVSASYKYKNDMIYQRTHQFILMIWLLAIIAVVILLLTPYITFKYDDKLFRCRKLWENNVGYMFVYTLFSFWIPGFLLIYFHLYICYKGYKVKKDDLVLFGAGRLHRSWSMTSIASLRDFYLQTKRRMSRSESLPTVLNGNITYETDVPSKSARNSFGEGSEHSGYVSQQKRRAKSSKLKPFITTSLILIPYAIACGMNVALIYLYSQKTYQSNQTKDMLHKFKYLLIAYFPYILGFHDRKIRKHLCRIYHRLRCWRSSQISPSPNIDPNDYLPNVQRRDSRRSSMISRQSSVTVTEETTNSGASPYYGKDLKNNKIKSPLMSGSGNPSTIFITESPINVPVVNC